MDLINRKKQIKYFMLSYIVLSIVIALRCYTARVTSYNTTVLAFSYKYGFISRGFIGTIYQNIIEAFGLNPYTYESALYFTLTVTMLFFVFFFGMQRSLLSRTQDEYLKLHMLLILFFGCISVSMFFYKRNFGRLDIYMLLLSLIAVELIIIDKWIFLTVPLCAMGVMVHQGYVFMFYSLVFILMCYRIYSSKGWKRKYYSICLIIGFVAVCTLFFYFELFSHTDGNRFVNEIINNAKSMGYKGLYHETLVQKEILGVDLAEVEKDLHVINFVELPFYIVFMLPYEIMLVKILKRMVMIQTDKLKKGFYLLLSIGSFAILPCLIIKVDYGRWIYTVICYYMVTFSSLIAMGDDELAKTIKDLVVSIKEKYSYASLFLLYPMLFVPFWDVHINELLGHISNCINENLLNIW